MARLLLVCGPTGAGKTTYSLSISKEVGAIRFSIDPWMQTLYSKDMTSIDYTWMIERVNRCYEQIWQVSEQILALNGNVVLDLGFTTKAQRDIFTDRANELDINSELHYLDAPRDIRKKRVETGIPPMYGEGTGDPVCCVIWALCGLPSLNLALLIGEHGLPIGVQRVGGYERDARLLQIARKFIHTLNRKTL